MRRILWLLAALAMVGCAPTSKPILLEGMAKPELDRKWDKYGAYYLVDECFVESSFDDGPAKTAVNKYIINKKIKILTPEGAKYGTVEVPVYASLPTVFRLAQWDSSGNPVKFATESIRAEFVKKGTIIFPNVTPGSLLEIYIEFTNYTALTTLEHWFSGPIPVAEGRFTFSHLNMYDYDSKAYGPVREGTTERADQAQNLTYKTWEVHDAYPRSNVDFQDDVDVTEPRVAIAMRRFGVQHIYESWEDIGDLYQKYVLKTSFFQSTSKLHKLVDSLKQDKHTDLERASAVFAWVQKNISFKQSELSPINPDRVVSTGQGNMWEMAVVLREMFDHLGLQTDILVTRPRSHGGFDPTFISPAQLAVTLVKVKIDKRDYLAYPWAAGAALGEFPVDFQGLKCLSLTDRSTISLPDFSVERSICRNEMRVHPEDENATMDMDMESGGYLAFSVRNSMMNKRKQDIDESYQRTLTAMGRSNGLLKCEVEGLEIPGKPVLAKISFSNPNQTAKRKGEIQTRLSHVFLTYFASYDTTRSSGFKINLDVDYSEILHVPKIADKTLVPSMQCRDITNALFRLTCITEDTPGEFVFKRLVSVNRKTFSAFEMRTLANDITELNRVRESSLVWKSELAEVVPANAGAKRKKPPSK